jgi:hypothetical protein
MTVYIGRYEAGDFFRFPSTADIQTALTMCEQLVTCPSIKLRDAEIWFDGVPPHYAYTNWEGQILAPDDTHFRLDLQGKPSNMVPGQIVWHGAQPPAELVNGLKHFSQWQLQFGSEGSQRLTRTADAAKPGYRTKYKGAIAGVMQAMNNRIALADFQNALQYSFECNAEDGRSFGVVISDRIEKPVLPPSLYSTLPKARFRCSSNEENSFAHCATKINGRTFVLVFATALDKFRYTKPHGMLNEIDFKRCPVCSLPLNLLADLPMGAPRPPKPEDIIWVDMD